jgi:hypothetical protein
LAVSPLEPGVFGLLLHRLHQYPATLRACNQGLVQKGHFFQHTAMAYDMISGFGNSNAVRPSAD